MNGLIGRWHRERAAMRDIRQLREQAALALGALEAFSCGRLKNNLQPLTDGLREVLRRTERWSAPSFEPETK